MRFTQKVAALVMGALSLGLLPAVASAHAPTQHAFAHVAKHAVRHGTDKKAVKRKLSKSKVAVAKPIHSKFLTTIPAHKLAIITLLAGLGSKNGGINFDGEIDGYPMFTVPVGWTVKVIFKNVGSLPHSVVFEPTSESESLTNPTPALPHAETPNPVTGTAPGDSDTFTFVANKVGTYKYICAYPGHAALGMWGKFIVNRAANASVKL